MLKLLAFETPHKPFFFFVFGVSNTKNLANYRALIHSLQSGHAWNSLITIYIYLNYYSKRIIERLSDILNEDLARFVCLFLHLLFIYHSPSPIT